jgi:hypothetical protein
MTVFSKMLFCYIFCRLIATEHSQLANRNEPRQTPTSIFVPDSALLQSIRSALAFSSIALMNTEEKQPLALIPQDSKIPTDAHRRQKFNH